MEDKQKKELSVEDAQAALDADKQRRSDECNREIMRVLGVYRCQIITPIRVTDDGRMVATPLVVAQ